MTWRDKYKVHPAADVFPMMSDEELEALGQDILENGLREPIKIMRVRKAKQIAENAFSQPTMLLDGRNRLEAMERVGIDLDSCAVKYQFVNSSRPPFTFDAVAYIISLNIHRRHLTKQQQAELIVAAVKAGEKPRQVEVVSRGGRGKVNTVKAKAVKIAEQAGVSKSTVERAIVAVDAKERGAVPRPNKIPGRPLKTKPKLETHTSIDVARRYYLEQCQHPDIDLDAEQDIVIDALREIAGKEGDGETGRQQCPQAGCATMNAIPDIVMMRIALTKRWRWSE